MPSFSLSIRRSCRALGGPLILIALAVWMLHEALFSGGRLVPSWPSTDTFSEYMPWRHFAFWQWSHGHFPWWDPHYFCGLPFFAQIQSCLLYPIAWVNFLFSPASAITLEMVLNIAIGMICMYVWGRSRGISRCGATLAGAAFPLSGAIYPHVLDGYVTVLSSAAWMPLVFLALDRLLTERFVSSILIGALAVCLEILAGHAQLVYYTFLVGGLYVLLESIGRRRVLRFYLAFAAIWLLGGMLAGVQLLPTYLANQLSVRAGGTSFQYVSMVSMPPENLLTIFIPYPFGGTTGVPYTGRWLLWETSLYVGIIVLALACIGMAAMKRSSQWRIVLLLVLILALMLGENTPIYWLLYKYLPGFGLFRGPSKFNSLWALLLAMLAGEGWDHVCRGETRPRAIWLTAIGAVACIVLAAVVSQFDSPASPLSQLMRAIHQSYQYLCAPTLFDDPQLVPSIAHRMTIQWVIAAALLAATSLLIYLRRFSIAAAYILLLIALADVCLSAAACNTFTPYSQPFPRQWIPALTDSIAQDQRLLFTNGITYADMGDMLAYNSIWGYGPGQPKRFTYLIAASQGEHPNPVDMYYLQVHKTSRIFELLRCRYILQWSSKYPVIQLHHPMPHLSLIGNYVRMNDPQKIADSLAKDFDFANSAILETDPQPLPTPTGARGQVKLLRQSINDLEIQADLPAPALLLITDAYDPGWHVRPIQTNPNQPDYQILCADAVLRAIPLAAGHHHFDLYYIPPGLHAGIALSLLGALVFLFLCFMVRPV